jgi:hypothetical protein
MSSNTTGETRCAFELTDTMAAGRPDQRAQAGRMLDLLFEGLRKHD